MKKRYFFSTVFVYAAMQRAASNETVDKKVTQKRPQKRCWKFSRPFFEHAPTKHARAHATGDGRPSGVDQIGARCVLLNLTRGPAWVIPAEKDNSGIAKVGCFDFIVLRP